ncbi:MAG: hypothetical protein Q7R81_02095 [Candidatus Peregrinibacteria bacterium]|nr:hypothetical protein [Candidatus Peregrinibacteria bacterium]
MAPEIPTLKIEQLKSGEAKPEDILAKKQEILELPKEQLENYREAIDAYVKSRKDLAENTQRDLMILLGEIEGVIRNAKYVMETPNAPEGKALSYEEFMDKRDPGKTRASNMLLQIRYSLEYVGYRAGKWIVDESQDEKSRVGRFLKKTRLSQLAEKALVFLGLDFGLSKMPATSNKPQEGGAGMKKEEQPKAGARQFEQIPDGEELLGRPEPMKLAGADVTLIERGSEMLVSVNGTPYRLIELKMEKGKVTESKTSEKLKTYKAALSMKKSGSTMSITAGGILGTGTFETKALENAVRAVVAKEKDPTARRIEVAIPYTFSPLIGRTERREGRMVFERVN